MVTSREARHQAADQRSGFLTPAYPNLAAIDLEIARNMPGRTTKAIAKGGISVVCAWGMNEYAPYTWLLDSTRTPRVFLSEDHMATIMGRYDGIVTWNGLSFDDPVMKIRIPDVQKTWRRKRHVDLHAICCLLLAGVDPQRILDEAGEDWATLVPTLPENLVNAGWSLEATCQGTLGVGKLEGPQGIEAIHAWQEGRYSEVVSYCCADVGLTRALFHHAWVHGWLESTERGRVQISRKLLEM